MIMIIIIIIIIIMLALIMVITNNGNNDNDNHNKPPPTLGIGWQTESIRLRSGRACYCPGDAMRLAAGVGITTINIIRLRLL